MGKTKKSQFFFGLLFGILMWGFGILFTGFLPTPGDGIEFGKLTALPIIFPAVLWAVCIFLGIKTVKNEKSVFLASYIAVLLIPAVSMLITVSFEIANIESLDPLANLFAIIAMPFIGAVIYGADIYITVLGIDPASEHNIGIFFYILYVVIAAVAPIAGLIAANFAKKAKRSCSMNS
ncbi:MAG: hypothetical protein IKL10_10980 [Clostridia bacterium]|nr:hypothetical protein [Clostridia bacterium]